MCSDIDPGEDSQEYLLPTEENSQDCNYSEDKGPPRARNSPSRPYAAPVKTSLQDSLEDEGPPRARVGATIIDLLSHFTTCWSGGRVRQGAAPVFQCQEQEKVC